MKILDNNGKVVFSGDWYPSAVTVFLKRLGKDICEYPVMEYLKNYWMGSLSDFIETNFCFAQATNEDSVLQTNCNTYLIPCDMEDNDAPEAYEFWQKILSQEVPGYTLENADCEMKDENGYFSKEKAQEFFEEYKDETDYFSGSLFYDDMYFMLKNRMKFGEAETRTIISALTLIGAKFIIE